MKYIITENKMNELVSRVLREQIPNIVDIEFDTKKVLLGSDHGEYKMGDTIEVTVVKLSINNMDKRMNYTELSDIYNEAKRILREFLSIDVEEYGSLYHVELYTIEKNKKFG